MIKKANKSFTVHLKLDFMHDPLGDIEVAKGSTEPGSYWEASISNITDVENRVINMQSAFQWEALVKHGGLQKLLKELVTMVPRMIDQNGLPTK